MLYLSKAWTTATWFCQNHHILSACPYTYLHNTISQQDKVDDREDNENYSNHY